MAHTAFLTAGIDLAFAGAGYLLISPSVELSSQAVIMFVIAYVGFACWGCFGPGWKPAAKGAFGGALAFAEAIAIVGIVFVGTTFWLLSVYPGAYYAAGHASRWGYLFFAGIFSVPLLLHAGVEAYYRLR